MLWPRSPVPGPRVPEYSRILETEIYIYTCFKNPHVDHNPRFQTTPQSCSDQNSVTLAQKQTRSHRENNSKRGQKPFWSDLCKSGGRFSVSRKFCQENRKQLDKSSQTTPGVSQPLLLLGQFYSSLISQGGEKSQRPAELSYELVCGQAGRRRTGAVVSLLPEAWTIRGGWLQP